MTRWKKSKKMNKNLKWTEEKRTMAAIKKSKQNNALNEQFEQYKDIIYGVYRDVELVHNVYLRMTVEYDERQDFMQQFAKLYKKLKRIKMIDMQKAASTWIPLLENQVDNNNFEIQ